MTGNSEIRFHSFESNIKRYIKKLRNEQNNYIDVTIATDDGAKIQAHKIILSAGSLFFQNVFRDMVHVQHPYIYLKGMDKEIFGNIIEFLYTGETSIKEKDVNRFLENARDLKINGIIEDEIDIKNMVDLDDDNTKVDELPWNNGLQNQDIEWYQETVGSEDFALSEFNIESSPLPDVKLFEVEPDSKVIENRNVSTIEDDIEKDEPSEQKTCIKDVDPDIVDENISTCTENDGEKQVLKDSIKQKPARKNQWSDPYRLEMQRFPAEGYLFSGKLELDQKVNAMIEKCDGMWKCSFCGKTTKNKGHIKEHAETHIPGAYSCHICDHVSVSRKALKVHIRNMHSETLGTCVVCGKSGISKVAYKDHVRNCRSL